MKEQACGMIGYDAAIGQIEKARNQDDAHFPSTVNSRPEGGGAIAERADQIGNLLRELSLKGLGLENHRIIQRAAIGRIWGLIFCVELELFRACSGASAKRLAREYADHFR